MAMLAFDRERAADTQVLLILGPENTLGIAINWDGPGGIGRPA
jgi:hypothetical protein